MAPRIVVAGGGLAGLSCALSLARAGCEVTILEASPRLGGKAGARPPDRTDSFCCPIEHGPHFFAGWYRNVRRVMAITGTLDNLIDVNDLYYLFATASPAGAPRSSRLRIGSTSFRELVANQFHNVFNGPMPWYEMLQSALSVFDLMTARLDRSREIDEISLTGFLRERWYTNERLAHLSHAHVLRGSALPAHIVSAHTMQTLMRLWFRHPTPFVSVLKQDLASGFIEPLACALGPRVTVRLNTSIAGLALYGGEVAGLRLQDGQTILADRTVVAVPVEVARTWVTEDVHAYDPELGRLNRLETTPMAALHVAFSTHLAGIPRGMVYLWESPISLNLIDLSQFWVSLRQSDAGARPNTVLSLVACDFRPFAHLSESAQIDRLLSELSRYVPAAERRLVSGVAMQANIDAPLFINSVGSWPDRPRASGAPYRNRRSPNRLFIAADYAQNEADLACMEGAVLAGLESAAAIARDVNLQPGIEPVPLAPYAWPQAIVYRLAKIPCLPGALFARLMPRAGSSVQTRSR